MSHRDTQLIYVDRTGEEPYMISPRNMIEHDKARPLSPAARLLRIYLHDLSRRPGWKIYVAHVQRALGFSPAAWTRARRELEAAGYYRLTRRQHPVTGLLEWQHFIYREPAESPSSQKRTIPPKSMDGSSSDGLEGGIRSTTQRSTTVRSSRKACGPADAAAGDQSRAKTRRERPSGIVCWYSEDHTSAEGIETATPSDELAAAVAAVRELGKDPVPGLVGKQVERARNLRREAERARAREVTGPLAEASRKRAEMERHHSDPVAREAGLEAMRKAAKQLGMWMHGLGNTPSRGAVEPHMPSLAPNRYVDARQETGPQATRL